MYRTSKTSRLIPTHRDSTIELLPKISRQIQRANHFIGEKAGVKLAHLPQFATQNRLGDSAMAVLF